MSTSPETGPHDIPSPEPPLSAPRCAWSVLDLVVFGVFFGLTVLLLPTILILALRLFDPSLRVAHLTAAQQVFLQAVMDVALVGFIYVLVRVARGRSFLETIRWVRGYPFNNISLALFGATMAVTVAIVSALFPPAEPPPIEKLINSTQALLVFAVFGIGLAPLLEEVIFRGFIFAVLRDVRGPAVAVPATAALFTLLHVPQLWGSWVGIALIFGVGYVLSAVRERSGSLIPSFIMHTAYNAMLFGLFAVSWIAQQAVQAIFLNFR